MIRIRKREQVVFLSFILFLLGISNWYLAAYVQPVPIYQSTFRDTMIFIMPDKSFDKKSPAHSQSLDEKKKKSEQTAKTDRNRDSNTAITATTQSLLETTENSTKPLDIANSMKMIQSNRDKHRKHINGKDIMLRIRNRINDRNGIENQNGIRNRIHSAKTRTILFYHFHKAGGTTMCELARANRERTGGACRRDRWDNNRNKPPYADMIEHKSCETQHEQMDSERFSFLALEYHWNLLKNCSFQSQELTKVIQMATFRHPISRLASQFTYNAKRYSSAYNGKIPRSVINSAKFANGLMHNFHVHRILGLTRIQEHRNINISQQQFEKALSLLNNLDVVFPIERICEAKLLLRAKLGWIHFQLIEPRISGDSNFDTHTKQQSANRMTNFEPDSWPELERANVYDIKLWEEANRRLDSDLRKLNVTTTDCPTVPSYNYVSYTLPYFVDQTIDRR